MDLKQIEYIVKIDDEHSITRAAEKLFVTQSALNQQLLRLEKELGAPLFHRSKVDMRPTEIGQVYLDNAREILRIKQRTYNLINDMTDAKKGRLSIGFTPGRGSEMFTHVYPAFHQSYPNVVVEPHELSVHRQQQMIAQGNLDIGFQTLSERQRNDSEYIKLGEEEIFLLVPSIHPAVEQLKAAQAAAMPAAPDPRDTANHQAAAVSPDIPAGSDNQTVPYPIANLALFQYEPFVLMYKESTIRAITDEIFRKSGFTPNVLFETASNNTVLSMIEANLCCGVVPEYYVRRLPVGISCFAFASHPSWDIVANYRKNGYLSEAAKYFIELVREFWM